MADALLQVVLENLNDLIRSQLGLIWGFQKEMEKLSSKLSTIQAVLEDAEMKQLRDKAIQNWLRKLKSAAYVVEDILDDCAAEALRLESQPQNSRWSLTGKVPSSFSCCYSLPNVFFRYKMGSRIKEITENLDTIADERLKFHFSATTLERQIDTGDKRQSGSILREQEIYGREDDKEVIVELLVNHVKFCDDVSVLPIIGLGGLGKTTLAQLIFNDKRITGHFEPKIWVCVSENFDVKRLIKAIIESTTGSGCETLDLHPLQKRLRDLLNGKRYFLVLDDVWNEDQEAWIELKSVLACGSNGASIITTTRLETVASVMGTLPAHRLSRLSESNCWLLFKQRACVQDIDKCPNLVKIGKEIVKKCDGVPLAAISLGGLMRFKKEECDWIFVKESQIWKLPEDKNSILSTLRLSYNHLGFNARRCFAYCAIFPKDYKMNKENMINLWIANGFISSLGSLEMEDNGRQIWDELYWRSFFQDLEKDEFGNVTRFKMHALVHDLAQSIMDDECLILDENNKIDTLLKWNTRHLTLAISTPEVSNKVKSLKSLIIFNLYNLPKVFYDLEKWVSLRVLDVSCGAYDLTELPSCFGNMRNLKYLNLSGKYKLKAIPESISRLQNLQTLILNNCWGIQTLPECLRCLRSLRHLYVEGCRLIRMPRQIGQLACLKTLSFFIVGKDRGHRLSELGNLNLRGYLEIRNLEQVRNWEDAKQSNLICKQKLSRLRLSWRDNNVAESQENVERVLEALEPYPNLQELTVMNYKGTHFPCWMGDSTLHNIVRIMLDGCSNCSLLPQCIGQLPSLRFLTIHRMYCIEYLISICICTDDAPSQGVIAGAGKLFPSLEALDISELPNLRGIFRGQDNKDDCRAILALLCRMRIKNCPKLVQLPHLSSLKELDVLGQSNSDLLSSVSKFSTLTSLCVANNNELISFPKEMLQNLSLLQSLDLFNLSKLKELPRTDQAKLTAFKTLKIIACNELESILEQELQGLHSLQELWIEGCYNLKSVTEEGIRHLTSLETLTIWGCPELVDLPKNGMKKLKSLQSVILSGLSLKKSAVLPGALQDVPAMKYLTIICFPELTSLPDWLGNLTSLRTLAIGECPKLSSLPESLQSLTLLRRLDIWGCPELENFTQPASEFFD